MSAFGWGGARYRVLQGEKVVSSGKLNTEFRPISLIWPIFGVLYVPKGLKDAPYDLRGAAETTAHP